MVKAGQIWVRDPTMAYYWGEDVGKLVIITSVSTHEINYRYVEHSWEDGFKHYIGCRPFDNFQNRFKLYKDI